MNVKIHYRNLELLGNQEKLIDRQSGKVRKLISNFPADVVDLNISVEKLSRGSQYQTALTLSLPQRVIRVDEVEDNPTTSVVRAFEELRRRIKRFKSQLNREQLWKRQPVPVAEERVNVVREVESIASDNLDKVENFIRREIFHQVVTGSLPPGILEPQALVDDLFLEVTSTASTKPAGLSLEQWMFQIARRIVRERIRELEEHRDEPHVEESRRASGHWEDEDLNFYQPDESLQLEDLLKDEKSVNPEELLARDEVAAQVQKAIARLPETLRESFILFVLEGFTSDEVAMMVAKTPEAVIDDVERARALLRKELSL